MSGAPLRAVIITHPGTFVLLSGKPMEYQKTADSGNVRLQAFCPGCGTAIYASTDDEPKPYNVRLGALRQRNELVPRGRSLFVRNSHGSTTSTRSRNSRGHRTDLNCCPYEAPAGASAGGRISSDPFYSDSYWTGPIKNRNVTSHPAE
jgi:hypothetical protein